MISIVILSLALGQTVTQDEAATRLAVEAGVSRENVAVSPHTINAAILRSIPDSASDRGIWHPWIDPTGRAWWRVNSPEHPDWDRIIRMRDWPDKRFRNVTEFEVWHKQFMNELEQRALREQDAKTANSGIDTQWFATHRSNVGDKVSGPGPERPTSEMLKPAAAPPPVQPNHDKIRVSLLWLVATVVTVFAVMIFIYKVNRPGALT